MTDTYDAACWQHAYIQGLGPVFAILEHHGYEVGLYQSGGFCMIATIRIDATHELWITFEGGGGDQDVLISRQNERLDPDHHEDAPYEYCSMADLLFTVREMLKSWPPPAPPSMSQDERTMRTT